MSNKQYDILKFIALFIGPLVVFFTSLSKIWNIPYGEQICATLAALEVLIGSIVVVANKLYKGDVQE